MDIFDNLKQLASAIECKYEFYDINHNRLLPGKIVSFIDGQTLNLGVIIRVNPKSTSIKSINKSKWKREELYIKKPNQQIVVDNLFVSDSEKQVYQEIYDQYFIDRKHAAKNKYYYIICAYYNSDLDEFGLATFKYQLTNSYHNKTNWNEFVENTIKQIPHNIKLYILNKYYSFDSFYEFNYKDLYKIGTGSMQSLLKTIDDLPCGTNNIVYLPINYQESSLRDIKFLLNTQIFPSSYNVNYYTINNTEYFTYKYAWSNMLVKDDYMIPARINDLIKREKLGTHLLLKDE